MKRMTVLLLLMCFLLSGCAGKQLEEELLVIVLSADRTEDGGVRVSVKAPRYGGRDGGDQEAYLILEAAGGSFSAAMALLSATTPRQLNFSQVREIVIGYRLAADPCLPRLLAQLDALPRFRCSAAVIVCRGDAAAFVRAQKPSVGTRLSRHAETTLSNAASKGFTPMTTLCEGLRDLEYGFTDPLFVLGAVNEEGEEKTPDGRSALDALPGDLPRRSDDGIELFGAAATDGVSVCGTLTGYEMALLHMLDGSSHGLTLDMEGASPTLYACAPAALTVDLSRRPAALGVKLACEARYAPGSPPDAEALKRRLAGDLAALIRRLQALRCDGVGFANVAVRQFLTVQDWEAIAWRDVYAQAEVRVQVEILLREG